MELLCSSGLQPLTVLRDIQVCCWITSKLVCYVFASQCQCFQHILQTRLGTNKMCIQRIYICCCRCASTQQICAPECSLHLAYHRFCFVITSNELHVFFVLGDYSSRATHRSNLLDHFCCPAEKRPSFNVCTGLILTQFSVKQHYLCASAKKIG